MSIITIDPPAITDEDTKREALVIEMSAKMTRMAQTTFPFDGTNAPWAKVKENAISDRRGRSGEVVMVCESGVIVEFWDGTLWREYLWEEIDNADAIKAAYAALPRVTN